MHLLSLFSKGRHREKTRRQERNKEETGTLKRERRRQEEEKEAILLRAFFFFSDLGKGRRSYFLRDVSKEKRQAFVELLSGQREKLEKEVREKEMPAYLRFLPPLPFERILLFLFPTPPLYSPRFFISS